MKSIAWELNVVSMPLISLLIHFIVGSIRGIYRHKMVEKYQYDYYDNLPLKLIGRLKHNWLYGTFTATAFYISIPLTLIAFLCIFGLQTILRDNTSLI